MRKILLIILVVISNLLIAQDTLTPVKLHGRLQVEGNKITSSLHGNPVTLRGMSLYWSQWRGEFYNKEVINTLAKDWKCTVVRAAMAVDQD